MKSRTHVMPRIASVGRGAGGVGGGGLGVGKEFYFSQLRVVSPELETQERMKMFCWEDVVSFKVMFVFCLVFSSFLFCFVSLIYFLVQFLLSLFSVSLLLLPPIYTSNHSRVGCL